MTRAFKGKNARIYIPEISATKPCWYAESASLEIVTNLEAAYSLDSAEARVLESGNVEVTGTLTGYWIDIDFLTLLERDANWALKQEFDVQFKAAEALGVGPWIYAKDCKAESFSLDISQDGFLMQDLDFRCKSWSYGTLG